MAINITMPALSPTMEEGTLSKWLVKEGDTIESGDIIAEIETDKATMEVESVDEGVVAKILVSAGTENVAINTLIAIIAEEDEDVATAIASSSGPSVASSAPTMDATPTAPVPAATSIAPVPARLEGDRVKASPLARRIAANKGIDLAGITGTGPHGRIVKRDVNDLSASQAPASKPGAISSDGLYLPQVLDDRIYAPDSYVLEPLDAMRKIVARRLTTSFMQVPHFPLNIDIVLDQLLSSRKAINAAAAEGIKISVNDMLIKAAAMALIDEPNCNASYTDNGIAYHKHANVSVAVAIDGGLITPVVFSAEDKGLADISVEMKDLATRARERKLKPQEYTGGTFSISNLGMFGIKSFGSIINQPEGMILSVGAGEKRAVVAEDGSIVAKTIMTVTLSCDHRVIGGAEGAKWLQAFKRYVETPEAMLL